MRRRPPEQPGTRIWRHSTADATPPAALLLAQILPVFLGRRALPAGRLARLGATPDFHHGLLEVLEPEHGHNNCSR